MKQIGHTTDEILVAIDFVLSMRRFSDIPPLSDTSMIYLIAKHFSLSFDEASKLFNRATQI